MPPRSPARTPSPRQLSLFEFFDTIGALPPGPPPHASPTPPPAPGTPQSGNNAAGDNAAGRQRGGRTGAPDVRHASLNGHPVAWQLRRARRRTIGFVIDERGLRVSAPRSVTLGEIERALHDKADWIVRKLAEWRAHEARRQRLAPRWEDGAPLRVLGRTLTLRIDPGSRGVVAVGDELRVGLPAGAGVEQLKNRAQSWLQEQARHVFAERIPIFAQRLGRMPTRWALSSARTRWGSCTADGAIRLNWRLVHFPLEIIDYVIAHELAHLREMNHSPRFWSTVGELLPGFEQARGWLRQFPDDEHGTHPPGETR